MITTLRQGAYKHGYLIITAAWLYTLSFIFINYWSYNSTPQKVKDKLEQKIEQSEKSFLKLSEDTVFLKEVLADTVAESKRAATLKPFGVFLYQLLQTGKN